MTKYEEFGKVAKEIFLSSENMSLSETLRILKEKYGVKIDIRTLRRWKKIDNWDEDRLRKYLTNKQLKDRLEEVQLQLMQTKKPDTQLIYAINILKKTIKEEETEADRLNLISDPGDEDELTRLLKLRDTLIITIQTNIQSGKAARDQLDELQKLDLIIQSSKKLRRESISENRVFMFSYDSKDHTEEVLNASS